MEDCLLAHGFCRDDRASDRYWLRVRASLDKKLQAGEPAPELQAPPAKYVPVSPKNEWYDALAKANSAFFAHGAESSLHNEFQGVVDK